MIIYYKIPLFSQMIKKRYVFYKNHSGDGFDPYRLNLRFILYTNSIIPNKLYEL